MPSSCCAFGCTNRNLKQDVIDRKVSFHLFPHSDRILMRAWLANIKRANFTPTKYTKICSDHFEPECFTYRRNSKTRFLTLYAVPTIFSFTKTEIKRKVPSCPVKCTEDQLPKHPALRKCWERAMKWESEVQDSKCLPGQSPKSFSRQSTKYDSEEPQSKSANPPVQHSNHQPVNEQKQVCCIHSCGSINLNPSITFYRFPKLPSMHAKWICQINSALPCQNSMGLSQSESVICSKHFLKSDFEEDGLSLKPCAVPTIFGQLYIGEKEAGNMITKTSDTPLIFKVVKENPENKKSTEYEKYTCETLSVDLQEGRSSKDHLDSGLESIDENFNRPVNSLPTNIVSNKPKLRCIGKIPNFNKNLKYSPYELLNASSRGVSVKPNLRRIVRKSDFSSKLKKLPCKSLNISISLGAGSNLVERKTLNIPVKNLPNENALLKSNLDQKEMTLSVNKQNSCNNTLVYGKIVELTKLSG